jgi:hypothetical protein
MNKRGLADPMGLGFVLPSWVPRTWTPYVLVGGGLLMVWALGLPGRKPRMGRTYHVPSGRRRTALRDLERRYA